MAENADALPPLFTTLKYSSWLDKVNEAIEQDVARADASFAERRGALSVPEHFRGTVADEEA